MEVASGRVGCDAGKPARVIFFGKMRATTVLLARSREKLDDVAEEIRKLSKDVFVAPADVSNKEEVDAAIASVLARFGRIDVLFNNAGKSDVGATDAPWFIDGVREMFEVDFLGTVHVTQAVVPAMRRQGAGRIPALDADSRRAGRRGCAQRDLQEVAAHRSPLAAEVLDARRGHLAAPRQRLCVPHPDTAVRLGVPNLPRNHVPAQQPLR